MANERLRSAMLEHGVTHAALAEAVEVDPKSVERWVSGRSPYRRHRYAVAAFLEVDEAYLWPESLTPGQVISASESEIVNIYPHRWAVPSEMWRHIFDTAESEIGVLAYSALFLSEDTGAHRILRAKASDGIRVRILLGDPHSEVVLQRGVSEGIDETMPGKIRNAITNYKPLRDVDGIEFRLHDTILYNSIYRADGQLLVNTHIYGIPAAMAPVLHLRQVAGGDLASTYIESFEKVWDIARPLE
jgi:transcriptional regulator with XRE-family HTH domain